MIENKRNPNEDGPIENGNGQNPASTPDLEEQEVQNSKNLERRISEANDPDPNYGDINESIDEPSRGEEDLSGFTERTLPDPEEPLPENDRPTTKNVLGDNPPGSEEAAFEAGHAGDMNADDAKFDALNTKENIRDSMKKTLEHIELDKKLKNKGD